MSEIWSNHRELLQICGDALDSNTAFSGPLEGSLIAYLPAAVFRLLEAQGPRGAKKTKPQFSLTVRLLGRVVFDWVKKSRWKKYTGPASHKTLVWVEYYKEPEKDDLPILNCLNSRDTTVVTPSVRPTLDFQMVLSLIYFWSNYKRLARRVAELVLKRLGPGSSSAQRATGPELLASLFSERTIRRMFKAYCSDLQLVRQIAASSEDFAVVSRHVSDPLLAMISLSESRLASRPTHYVLDHSALATQLPLTCNPQFASKIHPKSHESRETMLSWPRIAKKIGSPYGDPRMSFPLEQRASRFKPLISIAFTDTEPWAGIHLWPDGQKLLLSDLKISIERLGFEVVYRAKIDPESEGDLPSLWPKPQKHSLQYLLSNSSYALVIPSQNSARVSSVFADFIYRQVPSAVLGYLTSAPASQGGMAGVPESLQPLILRNPPQTTQETAEALEAIRKSAEDLFPSFSDRGFDCRKFELK